MRLYFARHGESEANVLGIISNRGSVHGLTAKGREQARALAERLSGAGVTRIYSSPLLRATETAGILSAALGIGYEVTDALREPDCGILEGRSDEASWRLHQQLMAGWMGGLHLATIEGAETRAEIEARFLPFIGSLVGQDAGGSDNRVLVGHGAVYSSMLPLVLSNIEPQSLSGRSFPNAGYVLAETRGRELTCIEWCGVPVET